MITQVITVKSFDACLVESLRLVGIQLRK